MISNHLSLVLASTVLSQAPTHLYIYHPRSKAQPKLLEPQGLGNHGFWLYIYMAPEVWVSSSRLTQKCGVYSFGIVLLEILTGQRPDVGLENDGKGLESFARKVFREEWPLFEVIDRHFYMRFMRRNKTSPPFLSPKFLSLFYMEIR